jgi:hypothetical protein
MKTSQSQLASVGRHSITIPSDALAEKEVFRVSHPQARGTSLPRPAGEAHRFQSTSAMIFGSIGMVLHQRFTEMHCEGQAGQWTYGTKQSQQTVTAIQWRLPAGFYDGKRAFLCSGLVVAEANKAAGMSFDAGSGNSRRNRWTKNT